MYIAILFLIIIIGLIMIYRKIQKLHARVNDIEENNRLLLNEQYKVISNIRDTCSPLALMDVFDDYYLIDFLSEIRKNEDNYYIEWEDFKRMALKAMETHEKKGVQEDFKLSAGLIEKLERIALLRVYLVILRENLHGLKFAYCDFIKGEKSADELKAIIKSFENPSHLTLKLARDPRVRKEYEELFIYIQEIYHDRKWKDKLNVSRKTLNFSNTT